MSNTFEHDCEVFNFPFQGMTQKFKPQKDNEKASWEDVEELSLSVLNPINFIFLTKALSGYMEYG